jgi:hypothetical protein
MRREQLGARISVVDVPMYGCPFCFAEKRTMAVYEHGVQWACGCIRKLPKLHVTSPDCKRCRSIQNVVVPFKLHLNIACITRRQKQKLSA